MNPFTESMFVLFAILTLGAWVGQWTWRGISLGTAGVLFAALVFGHFGLSVPKEVMDFGLLLFVYAVGLTAGPSFFRTFRRRGTQFVVIALVIVGSGAVLTALTASVLKLSPALAAGLYTGALTCTPALASLLDVLHRLRDHGNTVVVIEHNLDVIKTADWIIDLGPEGGDRGGAIIATGTPEQVAADPASHTGRYLKALLARGW